jgi:hypothetical protein
MKQREKATTSGIPARFRWKSPAAWARGLRLLLLIWVIVLGHRAGRIPGWMSVILPSSSQTNRPVESESPTDPSETTEVHGSLYCGSRGDRSFRRDGASGKLALHHLTGRCSHGHGFLIAETCFGGEHALRNGCGAHLRC